MVDYIEAIKKPFSDLKTLGIGAILGAIPLANLLNSGYALKTAENVMSKKNKLRVWKLDDLGDYIVKVIMAIIITLAYMIIPLIIMGIGLGAALVTALPIILSGTTDATTLMNAIWPSLMVGGPIILIGGILALIAMFLLPIATLKWIKKSKLSAAFAIGSVLKNALTLDYIIAIIVITVYVFVILIITGIIGGILGFIPIIGWILNMLIMGGTSFAILVTEYTILAQIVKD